MMIWAVLLIVLGVLALRGWTPRGGRPRARYRYTGMLLLVGIPGSGKTYKMLSLLVQRLAEGRAVRCNFNLRFERVYLALRRRYRLSHSEALAALGRVSYLDTFEDFVDAYDCDVFIDEAQDLCGSADWALFPHEVVTWFAQHRHRGCRIVMASHRFGAIHNYVRELIADIQLARPAPWFLKPAYFAVQGRSDVPLLQYVQIKSPEEDVMSSPGARRGVSQLFNLTMHPLDQLVASCYDTHGGVRPSPMAAYRRSKRKDELDLVLQPRREVIVVSRPADDLPALSIDELMECVRHGVPCGRRLAARWPGGYRGVGGVEAVPA